MPSGAFQNVRGKAGEEVFSSGIGDALFCFRLLMGRRPVDPHA